MARIDGREPDQLRPVTITPGYMKHAEGSVLIEMGDTHVICSVSVEDRVPHFLIGKGQGWITAEYSMLPRSTHTRTQRETRGVKGRTQEIQRLIGRAIRGISNLKNVGERTLWIDCDVIRADGGTRTASITGAYIAVALALDTLKQKDKLKGDVLRHHRLYLEAPSRSQLRQLSRAVGAGGRGERVSGPRSPYNAARSKPRWTAS